MRRFSCTDKAVIVARAGGRCERHGWTTGQCRVTEGLEADHVHPHSKGWTNVARQQQAGYWKR
jgi:hypothetical protein